MDKLTPEVRRRTMQAVKSNRTSLENIIAHELWSLGYRFRRNVRNLYGTPDISVKKYRAVIFIDSCFWHGCPAHSAIPATNYEYWRNKIDRNRKRDKAVTRYYKDKGWHILRVWEHELKSDYAKTINKIINFLERARAS